MQCKQILVIFYVCLFNFQQGIINPSKIKKIIESFEKDKWFDGGMFGTKLRNLIKDFSYKGRKVNSQNKLFEELKKNGIIDTKREGKIDSFKILK